MRVYFIHRYGSDFASCRYRCDIPAAYLKSVGIEAEVNPSQIQAEGAVVVFAKPTDADPPLAEQVIKGGAKVIFDVTDPHLGLESYKKLNTLCHQIVCATDVIRSHVGRGEVIPDPYEFDLEAPHADGDQLIWFGHKSNLSDLKGLAELPKLKIVSGPYDVPPEGVTFYSPQNLKKAMRESNISLIPTRKGAEYKSPNRLVNSIRRGLFPVVSRHPAHTEFKKFCWVGNIPTGIKWAEVFNHELNDLVREGQKYIEKYSPAAVGEQWKSVLESM